MATVRSMSAMLNEYYPTPLFMEELVKRAWIMNNIDIDNSWRGGSVAVPFWGSQATSIEFGQLASSTDISEDLPVRGTISSYKEAWGSMIFNGTDVLQHDGASIKDSFIKTLPGRFDHFVNYFKEVISQQLLLGSYFATLTANGDTGGTGYMTVDRIDRFYVNQKFYLDDGDSSPQALYVKTIDVDNNIVVVSNSRGGSAYSISGYTTAQTARCYHPGAQAAPFTGLKGVLLSAANGGDSTVHGVTKTSYPILQACNISGSAITATNILEKIFDAYTTIKTKAKGNATKVVLSFKHMGSIMKILEARNGMYTATKPPKATIYGWTEIEVQSIQGVLTIVGVQEMDNDVIMLLDMNSMTFRTNGGIRRMKHPDGLEYYTVRATTGYSFITDYCLFGELEVRTPGHNGIIYSVANY